jgi:DNA-binding HxlR family transcriptional regulator
MKVTKLSSTNQYNKQTILNQCPVTFTLNKIGGRWKPLILWQLQNSSKLRYNELRKAIPQISEKMLIQNLKELELDEIIERHAREVVPPFVEYVLSDKGRAISPILSAMAVWGLENQKV